MRGYGGSQSACVGAGYAVEEGVALGGVSVWGENRILGWSTYPED